MKEIPLTQGYVAIVDDEDYETLSKCKWMILVDRARNGCTRNHYARSNSLDSNGKKKTLLMHRAIMDCPESMHVDHIDGNGLNNSRLNLRLCTKSENNMNRYKNWGSSTYKGVHFNKKSKKWQVSIKINKKSTYLGLFGSELDAARAYDAAALRLFGEFARINTYEEI